jgi:hypothetical protein
MIDRIKRLVVPQGRKFLTEGVCREFFDEDVNFVMDSER